MCPFRERNFWYTYNRIIQTGQPVIVIEQQMPDNYGVFESNMQHEMANNKHVLYIKIIIDDNKIHKSRLINHATKLVKTSHVWVNDADAFLNFPQVLTQLNFSYNFTKPFGDGMNTTAKETQCIHDNVPCDINYDDTSRRHIHVYGALSFVYSKNEFSKIGGMDETYKGWGMEDLDLHFRVSKMYRYDTVDTRALHLWHPPATRMRENLDHFNNKYPQNYITKITPLSKMWRPIVTTSPVQHLTNDELGIKSRKLSPEEINVTYTPVSVEEITTTHVSAPQDGITTTHVSAPQDGITTTHVSTPNNRKIIKKVKHQHIHHTINYHLPQKTNPRRRVNNGVESIESIADDNHITLTAIYSDEDVNLPEIWNQVKILRNAKTEVRDRKNLIYVNDMFDYMSNRADDQDFLVVTNSDCVVTPFFYNNIKHIPIKCDVIEYHRRDVDSKIRYYSDCYTCSFNTKHTGIDGFAIRKKTWREIRDIYPHMFIGEPHWDTVLSGLLHNMKHVNIHKNVTDLYHECHDQAWSTQHLSPAGVHNTKHYNNCLDYDIIKNRLIDSGSPACTVIAIDRQNLNPVIKKYCENHPQKNIVIYEMTEPTESPKYSGIEYTNHVVIPHNESTTPIDQTKAITNIAMINTGGVGNVETITCVGQNIKTHKLMSTYKLYDKSKDMLKYYIDDDGLLHSTM